MQLRRACTRVFSVSLFFLLGTFFFLPFSNAASNTWTGDVSSDWNTAGNWSLNTVPTSSEDLVIPDASTTNNDPSVSAGAVCLSLTINSGGILNGNGQTLTVNGNWTNNGTFNHGNGTVAFGGTVAATLTSGASSFYDLEMKKNGSGSGDDLTVSGTVEIAGNLIHTDGELVNGQLNVAGNYVIAATSDGASTLGSTSVNLNGSGNQSISYATGGVGDNVRVDKTSGSVLISSDIVVNSWTYAQGNVTGLDTHTLIFGDTCQGTFTPGSFTYTNVEVNKPYDYGVYNNLTVSGKATLNGNLTQTDGELIGGEMDLIGGSYVVTAGSDGSQSGFTSTIVSFNGTGDQALLLTTGGKATHVQVNKASGTLNLPSDLTVASWTYLQGTISGLNNLIFGDDCPGIFNPGNFTYPNVIIAKTNHSGANDDFTPSSSTANISGNLTLSEGQIRLDTNNASINLGGNLSIAASNATFTKGTGTITFNGTAPTIITDASATPQNLGKLVLNKTNIDESQNKLTLSSSLTCDTFTVDGTAGQKDTLDLGSGGYTLLLSNAGAVADVFTINGTLVPGDSTVKYVTTNSGGNVNFAPVTFDNVELAGAETYVFTGDTNIGGNFTIGSLSTLDTSAFNFILGGNFTNQGVFIPHANTVTLNGSGQNISGNISFYNLSKKITAGDTLTLAAGSTININTGGSLDLEGVNASTRLALRSSVSGTSWNLAVDAAAYFHLDYLDVKDSTASAATLAAYNSLDSGNNTNWTISDSQAPDVIPQFISAWNSNTYSNLNTLVSTDAVTFRVSYNTAGDINWYKDGVLVKTDNGVLSSEFTTNWTTSDYDQMRELKVNSTTVAGTSSDTVWTVEVRPMRTATFSKGATYDVTSGEVDFPTLYLNAKQPDNAYIEYVKAKNYILKTPLNISSSTLYLDANTVDDLRIEMTYATTTANSGSIKALNNGTILIDNVTISGWAAGENRELDRDDLRNDTDAINVILIGGVGNNRMNITNSRIRHIAISYEGNQQPGNLVDGNDFYEIVRLRTEGATGLTVSNNVFTYGLMNIDASRFGSSEVIYKNNKAFTMPGSLSNPVHIGPGSDLMGTDISYSSYNLVEFPASAISRYNDLHDNGGQHNGLNGWGGTSYSVNDYVHDLKNFSSFYIQVNQHGNAYSDPATWTRGDYAYIFNAYVRDSTAVSAMGLNYGYVYNLTADGAINNISKGIEQVTFRKSSFLSPKAGANYMISMSNYGTPDYGLTKSVLVIDSWFAAGTNTDYLITSADQPLDNPIFTSVNSYRRNADGSIQLPASGFYNNGGNGEYRHYVYLDALVQDATGVPISGATVTVEPLTNSSYPAVNVLLPAPPENEKMESYPASPMPMPDIQPFESVKTDTAGHTPLPNYGWSTGVEAAPALLMERQKSHGQNTTGFVYRITATYDGKTVLKDVTPDISWIREDPTTPTKTVTLTFDKPEGKTVLTVNNGAGSGLYTPGQNVSISAAPAPVGKVFAKWIGDTVGIADVNAASTTIAVPSADASISPYYQDITYHLTVENGTGSGDYPAGKMVMVDATVGDSNIEFDKWTGTGAPYVLFPHDYSSSFVMPAADVTVTANYRNILGEYHRMIVLDDRGKEYYSELHKMGEQFTVTAKSVEGKAFDYWYGLASGSLGYASDYHVSPTTITMPNHDISVPAIYYSDATSHALLVTGGTGTGFYHAGDSVTIAAGDAPMGKVFDKWTGSISVLSGNETSSAVTFSMPASAVNLTATYKYSGDPIAYALNVIGGTGTGSYLEGRKIAIVADAPESGKVFNRWVGDIKYISSPYIPDPVVTMPDKDVSFTSVYEDVSASSATLTVVGGTGTGTYAKGQTVDVTADAPASGKIFDRWTGNVLNIGSASLYSPMATVAITGDPLVLTATYKDITVDDPVFSLVSGYYPSSQVVTLSTATSGAIIHYTTDGTRPAVSSPVYSSPLTISGDLTVKAMAVKDEYVDSRVSTATYAVDSSNASLENLTISSGTLLPAFSPDKLSYDDLAAWDVTSVTVTPTAAQEGATIKVNGATVVSGTASTALALEIGVNAINIVVTAPDGITQKNYMITVYREPNDAKTITAFNFNSLSPAVVGMIDKNAHTVHLTVPHGTDITALVPTVTIYGKLVSPTSGTVQDFTNPVTYTVSAFDSTTQAYTVTVDIAPEASTDAALSSLILSSGVLAPAFSSSTENYNASVTNDISSLTVTPVARQGGNATLTVNGATVASGATSAALSLGVGTNTVTIVVTAPDGVTQKTYTLTITREESILSGNATLSSLVISSGVLAPSFASGTTAYTASVANSVASLTVTPTVSAALATVTVNGVSVNSESASAPIALNVGSNVISVVVTAEDSTTRTYTLTVTREAASGGSGGSGSSGGSGGGGSSTTHPKPKPREIKITSVAGNNVNLSLAVDDASSMMLSNSSSFTGAAWETYQTSKTYTKEDTQTKLYIRFKSGYNILSDIVTLDIPASGGSVSPYPTGTLLKTSSSFKTYVMIEGKKKWIPTPEVFEQLGYKWSEIKILTETELNAISDYEDNLIRTIGDYKVYLVVNGVKRHIPDPQVFLNYGFSWQEVKDVEQAIIDKYKDTYLLKQSGTDGIYYVNSLGIRKLIPSDSVFKSYNDKYEEVQVISGYEMGKYPLSNLIKLSETNDIYLVEGNTKRRIPSVEVFNKYHLNWNLVMNVNQTEFNFYTDGGELR